MDQPIVLAPSLQGGSVAVAQPAAALLLAATAVALASAAVALAALAVALAAATTVALAAATAVALAAAAATIAQPAAAVSAAAVSVAASPSRYRDIFAICLQTYPPLLRSQVPREGPLQEPARPLPQPGNHPCQPPRGTSDLC